MFKDQSTRGRQQIPYDPLQAISFEFAREQCSVIEIGKQIVSQVGEQHVSDLAQVTMLAAAGQAEAAFVVAKLLDFGSTPGIVEGQEVSF